MTLLVIASLQDAVARHLVAHFRAAGADSCLMLCPDLARPGWRLEVGTGEAASLHGQVAEQALDVGSIRGVVTRLWAVSAQEIPFIHEEDRLYAAAEMQAFLLAWLAALRCPVLNAPSPGCLAGPSWSYEQWLAMVHAAKIRARPFRRHLVYQAAPASQALQPQAPWGDTGPTLDVSIVGTRCFGAPDDAHAGAALRLARAAGVDLLRVVFARDGAQEPVFIHADYWINAADPAIADAIRERCGA